MQRENEKEFEVCELNDEMLEEVNGGSILSALDPRKIITGFGKRKITTLK